MEGKAAAIEKAAGEAKRGFTFLVVVGSWPRFGERIENSVEAIEGEGEGRVGDELEVARRFFKAADSLSFDGVAGELEGVSVFKVVNRLCKSVEGFATGEEVEGEETEVVEEEEALITDKEEERAESD